MAVTTLIREDRFATRLTSVIALVSLYYLAYRYPFRINAKRTSPTYTDTPVTLQYGKYVLLAALCGFAYVALLRIWRSQRRLPRDLTDGLGWLIALFAWAVLAWGISRDTDMLTFAFAVFVAVTITALRDFSSIDPSPLRRIFGVFAVVAVVVDAIQVLLFLTTGRLPALGYAHSLSVRFGSLFDDPNGYAILCSLLLVVAWTWAPRNWTRIALIAGLLVSLLLTQSFTGAVATCVAVGVVAVIAYWPTHRREVVAVGGGMFVAGAAAVSLALMTPQVHKLLAQKRKSIAEHRDSVDVLFGLDWRTLLHGSNTNALPPESGYVSVLANFGVVGFVLFLAVGIGSIMRLRALVYASVGSARSMYLAAATFQIAFLIAMINLPPQRVFPLDILFFMFCALSCQRQSSELRST